MKIILTRAVSLEPQLTVTGSHLSLLEKKHQKKSSLTYEIHLDSWAQQLGNEVVKHTLSLIQTYFLITQVEN